MDNQEILQIGTILFSKDFTLIGINSVAKRLLDFGKIYFGKDLMEMHSQKAKDKIVSIVKMLNEGKDNVMVTMLLNVLGQVLLINTTKLEITSKHDVVYVMNFVDISKETGAEINPETERIEIKKIPIFYQNKIIYLLQSDIYFIKSEENYCRIFTKQKKYFIRSSLRELSMNFNGSKLYRVHKQYIINTEHVKRLEIQQNRQAMAYFDDENIPSVIVARRKVKLLLDILKEQ